MSSFVVKIDNIRELIDRIEAMKTPEAKLKYNRDVVESLMQPEFRRIKWFFYCDNDKGITIRIFDRQLKEKSQRAFSKSEPWLLLRGHHLGEENEPTKTQILSLFSELQREGEYPRFVTHKGEGGCLDYFEKFNVDSGPEAGVTTKVQEQSGKDQLRYRSLTEATFLTAEFFEKVESLLIRHRQIILEGPPGAGKTWVARNYAKWWTDPETSGASASSQWSIVQFHESYGYEDFFQGIRPQLLDGAGTVIPSSDTSTPVEKMVYRNANGIFYDFCEKARNALDARFVLIIDEINRGKASRIFGELLYLLEYRDEQIKLSSGETFNVPNNVYLIGTMNTADRSIALVDYALRRRFTFIGITPYSDGDAPVLRQWLQAKSIRNVNQIVSLFCLLNEHISRISPHLVVGHSYFMHPDIADRTPNMPPTEFPEELLNDIWRFSILPLLSEYEPSRSFDELEGDYGLRSLLRANEQGLNA